MTTKYLRKYNKFGMSTFCRICLTQSTSNMNLLETTLKDEDSPTILEALGHVMACKIIVDGRLPGFVCPMCLGLLKIAYDLKETFCASQESLKRYFVTKGDDVDSLVDVPANSCEDFDYFKQDDNDDKILNDADNNCAPVELVIGKYRYNIKDVVVVEENENEEEQIFHGFLNNLGSTISASFSKPGPKQTREPKPEVLLKKVSKQLLDRHVINEIEIMPLECYDEAACKAELLLVDTSIEDAQVDQVCLDSKNVDVDNLIKSALNMTYQCSRCGKAFMTEGRIKRHVALCGKDLTKICHVCERVFRCRANLVEHMMTKHNVKWSPRRVGNVNAEAKNYTCEVCGQVFRKRNSFQYHLVKHKGKNFMCEVCGKHFYTKHNVKTHMQMHQKQETKVLCPVCGKSFHYQSGLYYHMKLHKNERKHQCSYCEKKFYVLNALKRHIRTHTGQRPYVCSICNKTFAASGELKKHSYLHTSFRPHHCKYCKRGFTSKFNLQIHMTTHPGPCTCEYCDRSFVDTVILAFHIRHKHNIREDPVITLGKAEEEDGSCAEIESEQIIESIEVDGLEQFHLLASF